MFMLLCLSLWMFGIHGDLAARFIYILHMRQQIYLHQNILDNFFLYLKKSTLRAQKTYLATMIINKAQANFFSLYFKLIYI